MIKLTRFDNNHSISISNNLPIMSRFDNNPSTSTFNDIRCLTLFSRIHTIINPDIETQPSAEALLNTDGSTLLNTDGSSLFNTGA